MAEKIFLRKRIFRSIGAIMVATDARSQEVIERQLSTGVPAYTCRVSEARSYARNARWHALVQAAATALDVDFWALREWFKIKRGLVTWTEVKGVRIPKTKSLAFHAMSEVEFTAFAAWTVQVILTELLPGMTEAELVRAVEDLAGVNDDYDWTGVLA